MDQFRTKVIETFLNQKFRNFATWINQFGNKMIKKFLNQKFHRFPLFTRVVLRMSASCPNRRPLLAVLDFVACDNKACQVAAR